MAGNTSNIGFEKQIWDAACVLRGNIDASEYIIGGIIDDALKRMISAGIPKSLPASIRWCLARPIPSKER